MIRNVLLDTGPLLALVNARDERHAWARSQFGEIAPPLLTCEAGLSEACFLARRAPGGVAGILGLLGHGVVKVDFALKDHVQDVAALMRRYANVPMSLADACLVRMAELVSGLVVLTLDHDFQIYRRNKRQQIPLLMPTGE